MKNRVGRYLAFIGVVALLCSLVPSSTFASTIEGEDVLFAQSDEASMEGDEPEDEEQSSVEVLPQQEKEGPVVTGASESASGEDNPPPITYDVVIAQIQVGIRGDTADEYVSLYNNSSDEVEVTGWCVRNKKSEVLACFDEPSTDYILAPKSYIAISSTATRPGDLALIVPFVASNRITASNDTIALFSDSGALVDSVAWTSQPSGKYGVEKAWNMTQIGRLSALIVWRDVLPEYGRIEPLIECSDGTIAVNESMCPETVNMCKGVVLNEIAANMTEQFIEVRNVSDEPVVMDGCLIQTNRSSAVYIFEDDVLEAGEHKVVYIKDTSLTLTKTTAGTVYLLASDGVKKIDSVTYSNLSKDTSWSLVEGSWVQSYGVTPGAENMYEKYLPCEEGYWRNEVTGRCNKNTEAVAAVDCGEGRERNPATGRCRNIPTAKELAPCKEGQYRSEETNRCRSIALAASVLKPCRDDQFRNPTTNRCKNIASTDQLADCGEGRERNPLTNRCRNMPSSAVPTAPFAPEAVAETASTLWGWWVLGGIGLLALGYAGWEWRYEIGVALRKVFSRFVSKK